MTMEPSGLGPMGDVQLLEVEDIRQITPGRHFIHSLFHLDRPSATITIRTNRTPSAGVQYDYRKPHFALDPFFSDAVMTKRVDTALLLLAMEHEDALNEDFNLSTSEGTTVRQLAEAIWRKVNGEGVPLRLVHDDPFEYDVQRRVPDTEKAKKILGFEATTTLDEMLDEVIPWIDAAVKAGTI